MNTFEKMVYALSMWRMDTPKMYSWFHLLWLGIWIIVIALICVFRKKISPKAIDITLIVWGTVLILLEAVKLVLFSFRYVDGTVIWQFDWGRFPFQFCSTPLYVALPAGILRKGKIKDGLLSYIATFSLFAGLISMFFPSGMFIDYIFINLHTMLWHGSMVAMGITLLVTKRVEIKFTTLVKGFLVFIIMLCVAMILNISLGHHRWFNMFYISPYEVSPLEVFNTIWEKAPYPVFLLCYLVGFTLAATLVFLAAKGIEIAFSKISSKIKRSEN